MPPKLAHSTKPKEKTEPAKHPEAAMRTTKPDIVIRLPITGHHGWKNGIINEKNIKT